MTGEAFPLYRQRRPRLSRALLASGLFLLLTLWSFCSFAADKLCHVRSVSLMAAPDGGSEILVTTDSAPQYAARIAGGGKRIIVDIRNAVVRGAKAALTQSRGVVGGVLTQGFKSQGIKTTRILVQLSHQASYSIGASAGGLRIVLRKASKTAPIKATPKAKPGTPVTGVHKPNTEMAAVSDVSFSHSDQSDRVIVKVSGKPTFSFHARSATRSVLVIDKVNMASGLQRKLDTGAFGGSVRAISTYLRQGKVLIDVDHSRGAAGTVVRYGSALHYIFRMGRAHSSHTGIAIDGKAARRGRSLGTDLPAVPFASGSSADYTSQAIAGSDAGATTQASADNGQAKSDQQWSQQAPQAGAFLPSAAPLQVRRGFNGRRIDLDLKEANIHNVFRMIADVGRVNIVAADDVQGTVTIRMKNVPWNQALEVILRAKKLGMERRGNIIRIALAADLAKEREEKIAELRSRLALEPLEVRLIPVSYAKAQDMQQRATTMLSPRGSIAVDERTNVLIAQDVAGNLNRIEELVRALDTQTPQVLIEARIVEATSRFTRDVGIQWGGDVQFGPGTGNETGLSFPSSVGLVGGASDAETPTGGLSPTQPLVPNPNFAVNLPATVGSGQGGALGLALGSIDNSINLAIRLSAAEATGMLRIVSSPRILTLDNHEARINQGTLIPFSQVSAQGVQTVFQEAKLQLLVIPHVTADGSVSMHVKINRDEPDFNQTSARGDPTILKREAETELLVRDGHTAVIGGIFTRNTGRNLDQIPLLGDIPILGVLFQRRRSSDTRSELVIFITPRIVNRSEALGR